MSGYSEKPILFSAPMVRAIIAGHKTQTRRGIKPIQNGEDDVRGIMEFCPHPVGSKLWVRETFDVDAHGIVIYKANGGDKVYRWHSSIYMPREYSRISLEVTQVRVERVQDILAADVRAEGVEIPYSMVDGKIKIAWDISATLYCDARTATFDQAMAAHYAALWDSINGKRAPWSSNPWVWVYEFESIYAPDGAPQTALDKLPSLR